MKATNLYLHEELVTCFISLKLDSVDEILKYYDSDKSHYVLLTGSGFCILIVPSGNSTTLAQNSVKLL